ncbi:hypothetical protein [Desulfobacula toluolica]|uniref:Uncharacterized protein n=1 Tax=Desulfobacula toluolica (strain DSM 7467 / Tol2) TaxID=651182 RepID=K0NLG4_DESTT|nr:hypothetical protein [Desulfobacula toluolica]CCK82416.1 uncharacterized protein TOL2_C42600 [Desulfobacula toluolica Tol2]
MYASVTLSKTKKPRWFKKESPAFKNPKIIRGKILSWRINEAGEKVDKTLRDPYIKGEEIIRTKLPSYVIKIGESYRQDGKVKSRQKHIYTFDEWTVIDEMLRCQDHGWEYAPGRYIDGYDFDNDVRKVFPDADLNAV